MNYKLDMSDDRYIKITVANVITKSNLVAAMSELFNHPDYLYKHSLWDLSEASLGLTIEDLKEVAGVLSLYKPDDDNNFANKVAIVAPNKMHRAMVDLFISMSKWLPFKYKGFNDIEKAKAFLEAE